MQNKCNWFISILASVGLSCIIAKPGASQALLPYTLDWDGDKLEEQGFELLQDSIQLAQFQQYQLAVPYAKLGTQLVPHFYRGWLILGTLLVQQEDLEAGIAALRRAKLLAPKEEKATIFFTLGSAYFRQENYNAAVEELEAGLKLEPNTPEALFDLGNSYFRLEKYGKAIANYAKAFNQGQEEFWPAINNIGLVKYEQGDIAGAIADWQTALDIENEAAEPMLAVAVALYTQGEKDKGLALGEKALSTDIRYQELEFLKENLWGDRLLKDTERFLNTPEMQAALAGIKQQTPFSVEIIPN